MSSFVHLRLHTEYSLVDSLVRVPELMTAVAEAGMPAVALTDEANLFAMVKFYRAALAKGVKPLIGVDLAIPGERDALHRLTLLCQNEVGYLNLSRLVSKAYLEGQRRETPLIERDWLTPGHTEGLIALSGAMDGDVGSLLLLGRPAEARRRLEGWIALFGDRFYLELQRIGRPQEGEYINAAVALAAELRVPVVATNDVRFLLPTDFEAHEARVCIHDGAQLADPSRRRKYTAQQYLRSPEEMAELFADLPEALRNTVEIARRCSLALKLGESRLPIYPTPDGSTAEDHIGALAAAGLVARLAQPRPAGAAPLRAREVYDQRLGASSASSARWASRVTS